MKSIKTVIITGATGYIGSNIARRLHEEGYEVHIIVRTKSSLDLITDIEKDIFIHQYVEDAEKLLEMFRKIRADVVIHLAGMFVSEHKKEQVEGLLQANVIFSTQILQATVESGMKYFINTGTNWQNYCGEQYNPVNLYAATKEAFKDILLYYTKTSQLRTITLKLLDTYGPFDPRKKIMSLFSKIAVTGEQLDMSKGEQELGLVYIEDVIKAYMIALDKITTMKEHDNKTYLVSPKEIYTLKQIATIFEDVSGKTLHIHWGKRAYREREVMKIIMCFPNILEEVNTLSLNEGIKKMLELESNKIKEMRT